MKNYPLKHVPDDENPPRRFGGWLQYYRKGTVDETGRRLSQERMADRVSRELGTMESPTHQTISNWEGNRTQVDQDERKTLMALVTVLHRFAGKNGLKTPEQADQMLEQGGYSRLNSDEQLNIFGKPIPIPEPPIKQNGPHPPEPQRPPVAQQFIGRNDEIRFYNEKLRQERLVFLTGIPGVGKTALVAQLSRKFPHKNVFWHTFHEGEEAWSVIWKLAGFLAWHGKREVWELIQKMHQTIGPAITAYEIMDYLVQQLRGTYYLLCFDDFHLIDEDLLIQPLFKSLNQLVEAGELTLLFTSRRKPAFFHERKVEVLQGLNEAEIRQWLQSAGVKSSEETLRALVDATGGNAQFLILALDVLQSFTQTSEFLERIVKAADVVGYLLEAVDHHLSEAERQVMRAAAILLGYPITYATLESLLDMEDLPGALASLHRRALLVQGGEAGEHFSQHILIRKFYYNAISPGKRAEWHRNAAIYYEKKEQDNFLAALHYAHAREGAQVVRLVSREEEALLNQGHSRALISLLSLLDLDELEPLTRARAKLTLGYAQARSEKNQAARESYHQGLAILEAQPSSPVVQGLRATACQRLAEALQHESPSQALDSLRRGLEFLGKETSADVSPDVRARLYIKMGSVQNTIGDYEAAREATQQGLVLLSETPSSARASAYLNLGTIYALQGDLKTGNIWTRRGLAMYEHLGNKFFQLTALYNLAIDNFTAGNWEEAIRDATRALSMAEELGSPIRQAEGTLILGTMLLKHGDYPVSADLLLKSESLSRQYNLRENLPYILNSRADLALRLGREQESLSLLEEAEQLALELDMRVQLPETRRLRAMAKLAQGDVTGAHEQIQFSLSIAQEMEMDLEVAVSQRVFAQILAHSGQLDQAIAQFQTSLQALEEYDPYEASMTELLWGLVLFKEGMKSEASTLLDSAHKKFTQLGAKAELALIEQTISSQKTL